MAEEKESKKADWQECCSPKKWRDQGYRGNDTCGWMYFLTVIGTAVYFIQQIDGFWPGVLAILKAFVWPAILIYKVFTMLNI